MSGFWDDVRREWRSSLANLGGSGGDMVRSRFDSQSSPSAFTSPSEQYPQAYEGPAPRNRVAPGSQQDVWDAIARRHPRKFRKALDHMKWLERMESRYSGRTRP